MTNDAPIPARSDTEMTGVGVRVGLATAREVADLDAEGVVLAEALRAIGAEVDALVWDDADVDWSAYDVVVVRSTWDYAPRRDEFVAWARRVGEQTLLLNEPGAIAWTTDKTYLRELVETGRALPIVPTAFVEPGAEVEHPFLGVEHVVKPTVSAGAKDTLRLGPDEADRSRAHLRSLLDAGRAAMVQPYLSQVDELGETAVIFVDGTYSHAIRKGALLERGAETVDGLFADEQIEAREPSPLERRVAARVLSALPLDAAPLYCRVDLLPDPDGPLVLEVELAEPSLFLDHAPAEATARLADCIVGRVRAARAVA